MEIKQYDPQSDALEVEAIGRILAKDLSEPYSHYVYQYFLTSWPKLAFLAWEDGKIIGAIIASVREHKQRLRGYIAMLAIEEEYRGRGYAKQLIGTVIEEMKSEGADEITLETEISNTAALSLYENFGFVRSRRMYRYYLNASDAFRLSLPLTEKATKSTVFVM